LQPIGEVTNSSDPCFVPGACPICCATDAFVEPLGEGDEVYVECFNCKVYRATRKAFRHFEYLRGRGEAEGLAKLERLGQALRNRGRGGAARLEFDSWEQFSGTSHA
jgi:hypothetical protein